MTDTERRAVLENPDAYPVDVLADAWEMTAEQCRERGPDFAWAAEIAAREGRVYRTLSTRYFAKETR